MPVQKQKKSSTRSLTQAELVKKEIERLERTASGDWQTLFRQAGKAIKPLVFNPLQLAVELYSPLKREIYCEGGRGAGKSTLIASRMRRLATEMPRGSHMLIGETYQQILTRTLPTTIHGLEMMGLFHGLHYFVGRRPPKHWNWDMPYKPPLNWDKQIVFWTGACFNMVSQDVIGDGRSLNVDSLTADEAALLNKERLDSSQRPAVRGSNLSKFEKKKLFLSEMYCSTTPVTEDGYWFVDMEEQTLAFPSEMAFLKATCEVNQKNLPENYLQKAEKSTLRWIYEAEYLNIRPKRVKDGFYPLLDVDVHCYNDYNYEFYDRVGKPVDCRGDNDLVKGVPLILGVDWGATINCLTVNQHLKSIHEYRTLKSMYVLGEDGKIQDDLFEDFHNYYQYHQPTNRVIHLFYDNQGNLATGISKQSRAEQAAKQLRAKGWQVFLLTVGGKNESHDRVFRTWAALLKGDSRFLPKYRMNKGNCKELYVSMRNAKIKEDRSGIHKDKSSEQSKKVQRPYATDLCDANDKPVINLFAQIVTSFAGSLVPVRIKV